MSAFFDSPTGQTPQGVFLLDPSTGMPQAFTGSDRELVVSTYRCKTAFAGASVGDTITATQVLDVSAAPTTVSTVWRNQTTAADLGGAPLVANLELVGAQALTDAQLRAAAVPVSMAATPGLTDAQLRAAAVVISAPALSSLDTKVPAQVTPGLLPVDSLGTLGASRSVAMGSASASQQLTAATRRISIRATVEGFYVVGTGSAPTSSSSSHYIGEGERLDFNVPANSYIAAIQKTSAGTLYISELV